MFKNSHKITKVLTDEISRFRRNPAHTEHITLFVIWRGCRWNQLLTK